MGVNSLITWAVIDPIMRAVITETQVLTLTFCLWSNAETQVRPSRLDAAVMVRRGFRPLRLGVAVMLRRNFQALRLGHCVLAIVVKQRRGFQPLHLGTVMMLRRGFQALRPDHCDEVETWVSTLASWCCTTSCAALRLKFGLCFLMTYPQWFLNSLHISIKLYATHAYQEYIISNVYAQTVSSNQPISFNLQIKW